MGLATEEEKNLQNKGKRSLQRCGSYYRSNLVIHRIKKMQMTPTHYTGAEMGHNTV